MIIPLMLLSISFTSAYSTLSDTLNRIEPSTVILAVSFIVIFAFVYYSTLKFFKEDNKKIAAIVAFVVAFFGMYGINLYGISEINSYGWEIREWISNPDFLLIAGVMAVFLIALYLEVKKDKTTNT